MAGPDICKIWVGYPFGGLTFRRKQKGSRPFLLFFFFLGGGGGEVPPRFVTVSQMSLDVCVKVRDLLLELCLMIAFCRYMLPSMFLEDEAIVTSIKFRSKRCNLLVARVLNLFCLAVFGRVCFSGPQELRFSPGFP